MIIKQTQVLNVLDEWLKLFPLDFVVDDRLRLLAALVELVKTSELTAHCSLVERFDSFIAGTMV